MSKTIHDDVKLYWDGRAMKLGEVHQWCDHLLHLLDLLRDNYDCHRFLVRWILTVVYPKIKGIAEEFVNTSENVLKTKKKKKIKRFRAAI